MLRFLLDTDHLTLLEMASPSILRRMVQAVGEVGVSAVTLQESMRGRLAVLSQARDGPTRIRRYARLVETVQVFCELPFVAYDQDGENQFQHLRKSNIRIGTQDLKIGAIALAKNLTLLTRNRRDFSRIPGIKLDDWSV